jgi:hypothetical protein
MNKTPNPKWRPGKNRPAASAFLIQGPPLGSFTQESLKKQNPLPDQPVHRLIYRGFSTANSSEPTPSHRPWIFVSSATPRRTVLRYHLAHPQRRESSLPLHHVVE